MANQWYTLHVKPHRERAVHKLLLSPASLPSLVALEDPEQHFEVFFPSYRVKPANPRSARVRAYFPGYLFVFADLDVVGRNAFSWIPGAHGLVTFGTQPAMVPQNLIDMLKRHMAELSTGKGRAKERFKKGDKVRITEGVFAGYEAIFDEELPGDERVQVLLTFLGSQPKKLKLDENAINKPNDNR